VYSGLAISNAKVRQPAPALYTCHVIHTRHRPVSVTELFSSVPVQAGICRSVVALTIRYSLHSATSS